MIHLYQSNRLESLAEMMATIRRLKPLQSWLDEEEIIVQSKGMRRYLMRYLAQKDGIAANLKFRLPASLSWHLTQTFLPDTPTLSPFSSEVMRWRLLNLFRSTEFIEGENLQAAREVLSPYLNKGETASYLLAGQLADIFDQYLVYRPDWIESWQKGKSVAELDADEAQIWQMQLWQALDNNPNHVHRAILWKELKSKLKQKKAKEKLPQRYFVFGISALAPMYLDLLHSLGEQCDVFIFALNPCSEHWTDISDPAQLLQNAPTSIEIEDNVGHPLLASLGKQGQNFFKSLIHLEENTQVSLSAFEENPDSASLLHTLQHQIQKLILPRTMQNDWQDAHQNWLKTNLFSKNERHQQVFNQSQKNSGNTAIAQIITDPSIQIHSAHSPLRELQILKERILLALHENPDWQPHDIAVLTPQIESYTPFIESVFGQNANDGCSLPYAISDVKISRNQPFLDTLSQVVDILNSRFEADKILNLLESQPILDRFGLNREHIPLLHDTVSSLQIRWAADDKQRAKYANIESDLFTWQQGLDRLKLGWLLPENEHELWQGISAWHTHPDHIDTLSRFSDLIDQLIQLQHEWHQEATIDEWCSRVRSLWEKLILVSSSDQAILQGLETKLSKWKEESDLAQNNNATLTLNLQTASTHLLRFFNEQSQAGFLRNGITFCGMVPMRSLPFKMLCLLGLNDGQFPRDTKAPPFDLISRHPRAGDRARRDDDRYLFLEAIFSARECLYLSFVGRNIRSNEEQAPSVLIHELIDCIAQTANCSPHELAKHWILQHPLQAFSKRNFCDNARLFSIRNDIAQAHNNPKKQQQPFLTQKLPEKSHQNTENHILTQAEFMHFWRNPARRWLSEHLNWLAPFHQEEYASTEQFCVENEREIARIFLQAIHDHQNFEKTITLLKAKNLLPEGELGKLYGKKYTNLAKQLQSKLPQEAPLPEKRGIFTPNNNAPKLAYQLNHLHPQGQILFADQLTFSFNQSDKLTWSDKIVLLLHHLIFCATASQHTENHTTTFLSLSLQIELPPIDPQTAKATLSAWLQAYQQGQNQPLPLTPKLTLQTSNALYNKKQETPTPDWDKGITKAIELYNGSGQSKGIKQQEEIKQLYTNDTPPYLDPTFQPYIKALLTPLQPCIEVLCAA